MSKLNTNVLSIPVAVVTVVADEGVGVGSAIVGEGVVEIVGDAVAVEFGCADGVRVVVGVGVNAGVTEGDGTAVGLAEGIALAEVAADVEPAPMTRASSFAVNSSSVSFEFIKSSTSDMFAVASNNACPCAKVCKTIRFESGAT